MMVYNVYCYELVERNENHKFERILMLRVLD